MALTSGFFNAFQVNGEYDRKYNADDYSAQLGALIGSGVLRDGTNSFKVTASGTVLTVGVGRAWIKGRWAYNDTPRSFSIKEPPVGDFARCDAIHLRLNENDNGREITLEYVQGLPSSNPAAPTLLRADGIYDLCLARFIVRPDTTLLNVEDCRGIADICGWVTTPVGYDDFFTAMDEKYEQHILQADAEWSAMRDKWASTTLFKEYTWRTVLSSAASAVAFDIPQYDSTGTDILQVYVNGLREVENADYSLNDKVINFNGTKVGGTEILVVCYKSIDGAGLGTVSDEITSLQNRVAALADFTEYNYICTGLNDNIALSQIAQDFLAGESDGKILSLKVYGTLGATTAVSGTGTESEPYRWFKFGIDSYTSRRVLVDFCNTNSIFIEAPRATNNVIFWGNDVDIRNIRIDVRSQGGFVVGFNSTSGKVYAEKCRFTIAGGSYCYLAKHGTFTDCVADCWCTGGYSQVFNAKAGCFLKIRGGEYYSRCPSGYWSAPIFVTSGLTDAVVIAEGVSFPTKAADGYIQSYGVYDLSQNGKCVYRDIVSPLSNNAAGQTINVINAQKYDMQ